MKFITLNVKDFDCSVRTLATTSSQHPDLIIGILTGGGYLLDSFESQGLFEGIPKIGVKLQRRSTKRKDNFWFTLLLKWLPYSILDLLRKWESSSVGRSIDKINVDELGTREVEIQGHDLDLIYAARKILIVDDAIDSGQTVFQIKNEILKYSNLAPEIFVAVISWTISNSIVTPDYYQFKNTLVRFPWSKDYKGNDFEKNFSS